MKPRNILLNCTKLFILLTFIMLGCKKEDLKSTPEIYWDNPADIYYGTELSSTQLNAKSNIEGSFEYSPEIGEKLNEGTNQELKVNFFPIDSKNYRAVSKSVKINVIAMPTVSDIDGNVYHTIVIGSQIWMIENLKTTKYNDGTPIPNITNDTLWIKATTPAYCFYYNSDTYNKRIYGALYNWFAVNTEKLCPQGWHVPTKIEIETLINYIGVSFAADRLKESGNEHWYKTTKVIANNRSGFTALPGGYRGYFGFRSIENYGGWWCSNETNTPNGWTLDMFYDSEVVSINTSDKKDGYSVRCIKNK